MLNITENKLRIEIAAEQLCPSEHNHFRVEMDEAMEELIASIQLKGILVPLIVREVSSERYEILSGHRRHFAALKAGLDKIPVTILNVSDEDRDIIIADSNLQRPYIRTSEKAWAIRLKYDAFKRKSNGKFIESRTWDRGTPNGKSAEFIAEKMGISDKTVKRYIRLTYLEPWLLNMVDEEMIPLKAGVQLSYLSRQAQQYVFDVIEAENIKISEDTANMLRQNLSEHATMEDVFSLLKPMAVKTKVPRQEIKVSKNVKKTYFPAEYDDIKVNEVILTLIKSWAENYK